MNKNEMIARVIGAIGAIVLGLGLYGLNVPDPGNLHPAFADRTFVILLTVTGCIFMAIEFKMLWLIWKEKRKNAKAGK